MTPHAILSLFTSYPSMHLCLIEQHFGAEMGQLQGQVDSIVFGLQRDGELLEDGKDWELYSITDKGRATLESFKRSETVNGKRQQPTLF